VRGALIQTRSCSACGDARSCSHARTDPRLRETYDYIIIDTAPVLAVTDALPMSPEADSMQLVMRSGQTKREALAGACDLLSRLLFVSGNGRESRALPVPVRTTANTRSLTRRLLPAAAMKAMLSRLGNQGGDQAAWWRRSTDRV
jgi:hypothetical protein